MSQTFGELGRRTRLGASFGSNPVYPLDSGLSLPGNTTGKRPMAVALQRLYGSNTARPCSLHSVDGWMRWMGRPEARIVPPPLFRGPFLTALLQ